MKTMSNIMEYSDLSIQHLDIPKVDVEVAGDESGGTHLVKGQSFSAELPTQSLAKDVAVMTLPSQLGNEGPVVVSPKNHK
jgi:hypothetical protein